MVSSGSIRIPGVGIQFPGIQNDIKILQSMAIFLIVIGTLTNVSETAPVDGSWEKDLETYLSEGCYYQYRHYDEGEQIITSEPCLNCTCSNQVLMCYLRVCPFIKPVGKDCVVEKKEDQCCPTITCPQALTTNDGSKLPVELWTSTTLPPPMIESSGPSILDSSSQVALTTPGQGCQIDDKNYMDGMQIPRDPKHPCELCYCIRNHTACVIQECSLKVDGCKPIMQEGKCCPVKYMCEDGLVLPNNFASLSTSSALTTDAPTHKTGCMKNGTFYEHGISIESNDPCQHCYCMQGEIVCAVEPCMGPLEGKTDNCVAQEPAPGECCPSEYKCSPNNITLDDVIEPTSFPLVETTTLRDEDFKAKCTYEGQEYDHLSDILSIDPCDYCQCVNGNIICAKRECTEPSKEFANCKKLPMEKGECCHKYECDETQTTIRSLVKEEDDVTEVPSTDEIPDSTQSTTNISTTKDVLEETRTATVSSEIAEKKPEGETEQLPEGAKISSGADDKLKYEDDAPVEGIPNSSDSEKSDVGIVVDDGSIILTTNTNEGIETATSVENISSTTLSEVSSPQEIDTSSQEKQDQDFETTTMRKTDDSTEKVQLTSLSQEKPDPMKHEDDATDPKPKDELEESLKEDEKKDEQAQISAEKEEESYKGDEAQTSEDKHSSEEEDKVMKENTLESQSDKMNEVETNLSETSDNTDKKEQSQNETGIEDVDQTTPKFDEKTDIKEENDSTEKPKDNMMKKEEMTSKANLFQESTTISILDIIPSKKPTSTDSSSTQSVSDLKDTILDDDEEEITDDEEEIPVTFDSLNQDNEEKSSSTTEQVLSSTETTTVEMQAQENVLHTDKEGTTTEGSIKHSFDQDLTSIAQETTTQQLEKETTTFSNVPEVTMKDGNSTPKIIENISTEKITKVEQHDTTSLPSKPGVDTTESLNAEVVTLQDFTLISTETTTKKLNEETITHASVDHEGSLEENSGLSTSSEKDPQVTMLFDDKFTTEQSKEKLEQTVHTDQEDDLVTSPEHFQTTLGPQTTDQNVKEQHKTTESSTLDSSVSIADKETISTSQQTTESQVNYTTVDSEVHSESTTFSSNEDLISNTIGEGVNVTQNMKTTSIKPDGITTEKSVDTTETMISTPGSIEETTHLSANELGSTLKEETTKMSSITKDPSSEEYSTTQNNFEDNSTVLSDVTTIHGGLVSDLTTASSTTFEKIENVEESKVSTTASPSLKVTYETKKDDVSLTTTVATDTDKIVFEPVVEEQETITEFPSGNYATSTTSDETTKVNIPVEQSTTLNTKITDTIDKETPTTTINNLDATNKPSQPTTISAEEAFKPTTPSPSSLKPEETSSELEQNEKESPMIVFPSTEESDHKDFKLGSSTEKTAENDKATTSTESLLAVNEDTLGEGQNTLDVMKMDNSDVSAQAQVQQISSTDSTFESTKIPSKEGTLTSVVDMFTTFSSTQMDTTTRVSASVDDYIKSEISDEILEDDDDEENLTEVKSNCVYNGITYKDYDDIPSEDPCELCYCNYGQAICSKRECPKLEGYEFCRPLPPTEGNCCPEQYECLSTTEGPLVNVSISNTTTLDPSGKCEQDDQVYENGSDVPIKNKCYNSCKCVDKEIICDYLPCHPAPTIPGLICSEFAVEGECCPSFNCIKENETSTFESAEMVTHSSEKETSPSKIVTEHDIILTTSSPQTVTEEKPIGTNGEISTSSSQKEDGTTSDLSEASADVKPESGEETSTQKTETTTFIFSETTVGLSSLSGENISTASIQKDEMTTSKVFDTTVGLTSLSGEDSFTTITQKEDETTSEVSESTTDLNPVSNEDTSTVPSQKGEETTARVSETTTELKPASAEGTSSPKEEETSEGVETTTDSKPVSDEATSSTLSLKEEGTTSEAVETATDMKSVSTETISSTPSQMEEGTTSEEIATTTDSKSVSSEATTSRFLQKEEGTTSSAIETTTHSMLASNEVASSTLSQKIDETTFGAFETTTDSKTASDSNDTEKPESSTEFSKNNESTTPESKNGSELTATTNIPDDVVGSEEITETISSSEVQPHTENVTLTSSLNTTMTVKVPIDEESTTLASSMDMMMLTSTMSASSDATITTEKTSSTYSPEKVNTTHAIEDTLGKEESTTPMSASSLPAIQMETTTDSHDQTSLSENSSSTLSPSNIPTEQSSSGHGDETSISEQESMTTTSLPIDGDAQTILTTVKTSTLSLEDESKITHTTGQSAVTESDLSTSTIDKSDGIDSEAETTHTFIMTTTTPIQPTNTPLEENVTDTSTINSTEEKFTTTVKELETEVSSTSESVTTSNTTDKPEIVATTTSEDTTTLTNIKTSTSVSLTTTKPADTTTIGLEKETTMTDSKTTTDLVSETTIKVSMEATTSKSDKIDTTTLIDDTSKIEDTTKQEIDAISKVPQQASTSNPSNFDETTSQAVADIASTVMTEESTLSVSEGKTSTESSISHESTESIKEIGNMGETSSTSVEGLSDIDETTDNKESVIDASQNNESTTPKSDLQGTTHVEGLETATGLPLKATTLSEAEGIETTASPTDSQSITTLSSENKETTAKLVESMTAHGEDKDITTTTATIEDKTEAENISSTEKAQELKGEDLTTQSNEITTLPESSVDSGNFTTQGPDQTTIVSDSHSTTFIYETTTKSTTSNKLKFCILNGMIVKNGGDVPDTNPCKLCQCVDGEVTCATQICAPPTGYQNCSALPVEEGICCPKYSCELKTKILDDDEAVTEAEQQTQKVQTSTALTSPTDITTSKSSFLSGVIGTASSDILDENQDETAVSSSTSKEVFTDLTTEGYDEQISLESIGPGACLFDGKVYVSAQQIPRNNPCDFCFCFRGDIICLQQSCPPPIPGCREEIIDGFCCPRYECPVTMGVKNVTETAAQPSLVSWLFGEGDKNKHKETVTTQVRGCEIQGDFYEVGAIVDSASGPCLQCRCGLNEKLECEPQKCEPQPLVKRMLSIRR